MITPGQPLNLLDADFLRNKYAYYAALRERAPVHIGRISVLKVHLVSRYEDCEIVLRDDRFVRNRSTVTGGGRLPFPLPKSVALVAQSMIVEDDPEHRRLRNLVQKAFTPRALRGLEEDIEALCHRLLDAVTGSTFELQQAYALAVPVNVISRLVGVPEADMPQFKNAVRVLSEGFSGWAMLRTVAFDMPRAVRFMRGLIERKRTSPGDDILTGLIEAEEQGDRLSEDELVSMVFLLIVAGYETTVHLISNGVVALTQHPAEMARLRAEPELMGSAVEEMLRFNGPVHGTKMNYPREDVELHGAVIPRGAPTVPLLGAANHDPKVFPGPERFDITRDPNRHLAFAPGKHFCLGAFLARMETRIALQVLLERFPNLALAVPAERLTPQKMPLWHRYDGVPVRVRG